MSSIFLNWMAMRVSGVNSVDISLFFPSTILRSIVPYLSHNWVIMLIVVTCAYTSFGYRSSRTYNSSTALKRVCFSVVLVMVNSRNTRLDYLCYILALVIWVDLALAWWLVFTGEILGW